MTAKDSIYVYICVMRLNAAKQCIKVGSRKDTVNENFVPTPGIRLGKEATPIQLPHKGLKTPDGGDLSKMSCSHTEVSEAGVSLF